MIQIADKWALQPIMFSPEKLIANKKDTSFISSACLSHRVRDLLMIAGCDNWSLADDELIDHGM